TSRTVSSADSARRSPIRTAKDARNDWRNERVRERPERSRFAPARVIAEVAWTSSELYSSSTERRLMDSPTTVANPAAGVYTDRHPLALATTWSSSDLGFS